jgi:hypothetical protein
MKTTAVTSGEAALGQIDQLAAASDRFGSRSERCDFAAFMFNSKPLVPASLDRPATGARGAARLPRRLVRSAAMLSCAPRDLVASIP